MKKIFTLFALFCACFILNAQTIPNANFEQWTSDNEATGWASTFSMPLMDMFTIDYSSVQKSSNSHSGWAMGVHPYEFSVGGVIPLGYTLPGIAHLGTFNLEFDIESLMGGLMGGGGNIDASSFIDGMVQGGIACNRVPQSVKAWIRYVPASGDAMSITVRCYNSNNTVVAEGVYNQSTASSSYQQITIPVTATSSAAPTQMNIIINCGNQAGTELFVDDMELVMEGGGGGDEDGIEEAANVIFSVSPNPTSDVLTINPTVGGNYNAALFDMGGKAVWEGQQLQGATQVDVTSFSEGVYFLKVTANGLSRTQKVVVR